MLECPVGQSCLCSPASWFWLEEFADVCRLPLSCLPIWPPWSNLTRFSSLALGNFKIKHNLNSRHLFGCRRVAAEKGDPLVVRHFWRGWMLGLYLYLNIFPLVSILYKLYLLYVKHVLVPVRYFLLLLTATCLNKGKYQKWWGVWRKRIFCEKLHTWMI